MISGGKQWDYDKVSEKTLSFRKCSDFAKKYSTKHELKWKLKPAGIYLLKVNNKNNRTRCEICSKLTRQIPERRQSNHEKTRIIAWKVSEYEDFSGPYVPVSRHFSCSGCHINSSYLCISLYPEGSTHLNIHTCSYH